MTDLTFDIDIDIDIDIDEVDRIAITEGLSPGGTERPENSSRAIVRIDDRTTFRFST